MENIPLLLFDIICLPITMIRLILIYFFGSRYNIPSLQFLDVMMHATNKFFNQCQKNITIDTIPTDIRISINESSRVNPQLLNENIKTDIKISNTNMITTQNTINNLDNVIGNNEKIMNKNNVFGQKEESIITLRTNLHVSQEDIEKIQILLPNILQFIDKMNDNDKKCVDTDNIDISTLEQKLNDEIKREFDFLSLDLENYENDIYQIDSITDHIT